MTLGCSVVRNSRALHALRSHVGASATAVMAREDHVMSKGGLCSIMTKSYSLSSESVLDSGGASFVGWSPVDFHLKCLGLLAHRIFDVFSFSTSVDFSLLHSSSSGSPISVRVIHQLPVGFSLVHSSSNGSSFGALVSHQLPFDFSLVHSSTRGSSFGVLASHQLPDAFPRTLIFSLALISMSPYHSISN